MKRVILIGAILLSLVNMEVLASVNNLFEYAEKLSAIGVFRGTGDGYDLERPPTRLEGLIMLIRLLGVEDEALKLSDETTRFTDVPDWGRGYVVYAYNNGLTKGKTDTLFGTNDIMQAKSYVTFLLRALNYSDSNGDFEWAKAIDFAYEKGIVDTNDYSTLSNDMFTRGHVAKLSYDVLFQSLKDDSINLMTYLVNKGSIDQSAAAALAPLDISEIEEELDFIAYTEDKYTYLSWNDINDEYYFMISVDGGIYTPLTYTGNYLTIDGKKSQFFDNLKEDKTYKWEIYLTINGVTNRYYSNTIIGPNPEVYSISTTRGLESYLNENELIVYLGDYSISLDRMGVLYFRMDDASSVDDTFYVYGFIDDASTYNKFNDIMLNDENQMTKDILAYAKKFSELSGKHIYFSFIFEAEYDTYPLVAENNGLYYNIYQSETTEKYHLFYTLFNARYDMDGYNKVEYWYYYY